MYVSYISPIKKKREDIKKSQTCDFFTLLDIFSCIIIILSKLYVSYKTRKNISYNRWNGHRA